MKWTWLALLKLQQQGFERPAMSTTLLYQMFGIQGGYAYQRTDYYRGSACFVIEQRREKYRCAECGSAAVHAQGHKNRFLRSLPIGGKPTFVFLKVARVLCFRCEHSRQVKVPFADPWRTYTHAFERYALELSQFGTIQDVARHLDVSWDIIKDIQKRHLLQKFSKPKLKNLQVIAIDELAIGKGHHYVTLVLDLRSGAVVFVGDGKGVEALTPFWKRLRAANAKVRAVATDMSKAYIRAVRDHLPQAIHVFDHFHVVKLYNDKLSAFRRDLYRELTDVQERRILKGTRWLLLKNPENLDDDRNETERLAEALELNTPLTLAYYMKEDLKQIWNQGSKAKARRVLDDWIRRAKASKVGMLLAFADTLHEHRDGILAYYDCPISTGPLEGVNTKIQAMKRQAFGFRDPEFFKLKILALHKSRYALVG
jgi:transposase